MGVGWTFLVWRVSETWTMEGVLTTVAADSLSLFALAHTAAPALPCGRNLAAGAAWDRNGRFVGPVLGRRDQQA